jgi:hypothetical protein
VLLCRKQILASGQIRPSTQHKENFGSCFDRIRNGFHPTLAAAALWAVFFFLGCAFLTIFAAEPGPLSET